MTRYIPDRAWTIFYAHNLLVLNAGADNIFAIEDVASETTDELITLWKQESIDPKKLSPEAKNIFTQLVSANIVRLMPDTGKQAFKSVALIWAGNELPPLQTALFNSGHTIRIVSRREADFIIFIRTNIALKELINEDYAHVDTPHLLIDLAYHHTVSIGPLVYPDETACIGCLIGRLSNYWGDPPPPPQPHIGASVRLIAELVALELKKIQDGDESLVNKTVAYDFQNRDVKIHAIYKLPWCPICKKKSPIEHMGSIELPWTKDL